MLLCHSTWETVAAAPPLFLRGFAAAAVKVGGGGRSVSQWFTAMETEATANPKFKVTLKMQQLDRRRRRREEVALPRRGCGQLHFSISPKEQLCQNVPPSSLHPRLSQATREKMMSD